ncbi:MAG: gliding motility-associated C-terminal domain-containing protein [Crocinitomicaceae bacterium]|nr:gliding motility-associated C-terminal domain-containing protein [Crocinitomicaceae bacterium]
MLLFLAYKFRLPPANFILLGFFLCAFQISGYGQLDTKHFIPPMHARTLAGNHFLVLGTPVSTSFDVLVTDGAGNIIATLPVSNAASTTISLGSDYNSPFMASETQLNTVLGSGKGLILSASEPFYASIRVLVHNQAGSLTSKGEGAALGKDFRTGHMINNSAAGDIKSNCFSIMATEDNTTVLISDINPGVIFRGTSSFGSPLTSADVTIQLNSGESYVVSTYADHFSSTNNINGLNGTHITSDKDIVVNCGTWLGGNSILGTSPNGTPFHGKDIGIDQMVPIDNIGTDYVLIKGFGIDNERTMVIASMDNTDIFINGGSSPVGTINAGDVYIIEGTAFSSNDNLFLHTSEPVYVTQTTNGGDGLIYDFEHQSGINFLPPVLCTGDKSVTIPDVGFIGTAYINIVADAGAIIYANGTLIGGAMSVTGTSDYETYFLFGYTGDVKLTSTLPIRVALINFNNNVGAAGYFSGFSKEININGTFQNNSYSSNDEISEGCGVATITIDRHSIYAANSVTISLVATGTAQEGLDYSSIPTQVTLAPGQTQATFSIDAFSDNLTEGDEEVIITLSVEGGNCGEDELSFLINDVLDIEVDIEDQNILCSGDDATLIALVTGGLEPYTFFWTSGDTTDQITVNPQSTTSYSLFVTDFCEIDTAFVSATVTVPVFDFQVYLPEDTTVLCPYTPLLFVAEAYGGTEYYNYQWTLNGTTIGSGPLLNSSSATTSNYVVQVMDHCGLVAEDSITVDVITPLMELIINEDRLICPYDDAELWVEVNGGLPPFTYYWDHSGETDSNVWVNPGSSTLYLVTVSDACSTYNIFGTPYVEVTQPEADFSILSNTQVNNLPIYFNNTTVGGVYWEWDLGNGDFSDLFSPGTTYLNEETYTVTLVATNELGCTDTVIKEIIINPEFWFYAPNAFTPDGNEFNNGYSVSVIGAIEFEFNIFNRWGQLIFKTNNPEFIWDGSFNNQNSEDGVYVYKSTIVGEDNETRQYTGHIVLLR